MAEQISAVSEPVGVGHFKSAMRLLIRNSFPALANRKTVTVVRVMPKRPS